MNDPENTEANAPPPQADATDPALAPDTNDHPESQSSGAYRVEFVGVKMLELGEYKTYRRQVGVKKVKKAKGLFTKETVEVDQPIYETVREWQSSGRKSLGDIDTDDFKDRVENRCNQLHNDGYEIISIVPIIKGAHDYFVQPGILQKGTGSTSIAYAYGHGVTDGVLITARHKQS